MQKKCNSSALAMELRLFRINPSVWNDPFRRRKLVENNHEIKHTFEVKYPQIPADINNAVHISEV